MRKEICDLNCECCIYNDCISDSTKSPYQIDHENDEAKTYYKNLQRKKHQVYYQEHKDKIKNQALSYYYSHKEEVLKKKKERYHANKGKKQTNHKGLSTVGN